MILYSKIISRERDLLKNEIDSIIEGFPREENNETFESDIGYREFQRYNELREKRLNLEGEQSTYFLEVQRVEGDKKNNEEEQQALIAPTLTRSLGEDFSLQL